MIIYINRPIPETCAGCVLCNSDMVCLATNSRYYSGFDEKPTWCPIEQE